MKKKWETHDKIKELMVYSENIERPIIVSNFYHL